MPSVAAGRWPSCVLGNDDEVRVLRSPAQVFIPAGLRHTLRVVGGPGSFLHVVRNGDYDSSLAG